MRNDFPFLIFDYRSFFVLIVLILIISCSTSGSSESSKFTNYYNQGELLYTKHCSNCHQPTGAGLGRVYPPLHQSDFMSNEFERVICLMKNGIQGELLVNGESYNQPMPGVPTLTDLEIAEIATYIYNSWSHNRGIVEVKEVSSVLQQCSASQ